jgi:hypothetical protein
MKDLESWMKFRTRKREEIKDEEFYNKELQIKN